jgi:hypothetical protein
MYCGICMCVTFCVFVPLAPRGCLIDPGSGFALAWMPPRVYRLVSWCWARPSQVSYQVAVAAGSHLSWCVGGGWVLCGGVRCGSGCGVALWCHTSQKPAKCELRAQDLKSKKVAGHSSPSEVGGGGGRTSPRTAACARLQHKPCQLEVCQFGVFGLAGTGS